MLSFFSLYQKLSNISALDFCLLESEFFSAIQNHFSAQPPVWATAFLTVSSWFACSQRSGVWTFYETACPLALQNTAEYLHQSGQDEMADMFCFGIHDYQNPQYAAHCSNYPEEWIEQSQQIDDWIADHENFLWEWEYQLLLSHKNELCPQNSN